MRVFYFLFLSFLFSSAVLAQGNLPYEYLGIETNGVIYRNDTIQVCAQPEPINMSFNAEYLPIGLVGDEYNVFSIPYTTIYPTDANDLGGGVTINADDTFSPIVNLPFTFSFFGNSYTQLVVGANGRVLFDTTYASNYDAWAIADDDTLPTAAIEGNSIMGVYQDININDNSATAAAEFNYGIYGEAPFRAFVVNFKEIPLYGNCDVYGGQNYQIILHEGTSAIDVIVHNRDACDNWNNGNGVIGIMNENSTVAYTPPGRNTGDWDAFEEAWRFLPSGGGFDSATTINWLINGVYDSADTTLQQSITDDTLITLQVDYYLNVTNETATATTNLFIDYIDLSLAEGDSLSICQGSETTLNAEQVYDSYNWYYNGELIPGENSQSLSGITQAGEYTVEYVTDNCSASDAIQVVFGGPTLNAVSLEDCESDFEDGFDLTSVQSQHSSDTNLNYTYFTSMSDAENNTGAITNATNYPLTSGLNEFYVRGADNEECYSITTLSIQVNSGPELAPVSVEGCNTEMGETFDLTSVQSQHSSDTSLSYSYFLSETDAENNTNAISEADASNYPIQVGSTMVYVRAVNSNGCYAVTTLTINVYSGPELAPVSVEGCNTEMGETFDLTSVQSQHSSDTSLSYSYFLSETDAENNANAIADADASNYPIQVGSTMVYVRAVNSNGCYSVTTLTINVNLGPELAPVSVEGCNTEMGETFDLTSVQSQHSSDTSLSYSYFLSETDAENNTNAISEADASNYSIQVGSTMIYVRAVSSNGCYAVTTLTINVYSGPELAPVLVEGCNTEMGETFDLTSVQSQHSSDTSLSYSYFLTEADAQSNTNAISEADASNYSIQEGSTMVYVRAENSETCFSVTTLTITVFPQPEVSVVVNYQTAVATANLGNPPYEYSIDNINWQTSATFSNLSPGEYTMYVRSANGCIGMTTFEITLNEIDYIPSVITPNGDGINDTWVIGGIQYFPNSSVKLFDRYGKLIVDIITDGSTDEVWNAKYLNEKLPSTTYWYIINLSDGQQFKGYLVVRNRNSKAQL